MTEERIAELAALMPKQGAPKRVDMVAANSVPSLKGEFNSDIYASAFATGNPRFQFLFATAYFHSGHLLNGRVTERWIIRAHRAFTHPHLKDPVMTQVFRLFIQNGHGLSHRINALVLGNAPREIIAELCNKTPEVIEAYENIFFDLRDRLSNAIFISTIVHPELCFYDSTCGSNMQRLYGVAYDHGWQSALAFMGIKNTSLAEKSTSEMTNEYLRNSMIHSLKISMDSNAMPAAFYVGQTKTLVGAEAQGKASGMGGNDPMANATGAGNRCIGDLDTQTRARLTNTVDIK